jgi:hypothetical protein
MVLILTSGGSLQWICYCYICIILEKVWFVIYSSDIAVMANGVIIVFC